MKLSTFKRLLLSLGCRQRSDNRSLVTQCPKCGAKDAFDCRGQLSRANLQCDTCNSRMEVMGWETDGHHTLWFDFPPHIHKRKQARKFAQAIRLLLPPSCLMHADTEEVFGCQIIRVGAAELERMAEEQAERHEFGCDPEEVERAKAQVLAKRQRRAKEIARKMREAKAVWDAKAKIIQETKGGPNHCRYCDKPVPAGFVRCQDCQNAESN